MIYAARLLRVLVRRDQPLSPELAAYFAEQVVSENPQIRRSAQVGLVKILYLLKLRTMCENDRDLVLMRPKNPLRKTERMELPVDPSYTEQYFADFAGDLTPEAKLRDQTSQGWLVWGKETTYYSVPAEGDGVAFQWDPSSQGAIDSAKKVMADDSWWKKVFEHLSQEKDRDYIGAEAINFIKSIFQVS